MSNFSLKKNVSREIPRDFTAMKPSDLPRAEAREEDWYAKRATDLEAMPNYSRVWENQPPTKPTLREEIARKLLGSTMTNFAADWMLPIDEITDAAYALGSREPGRIATEGALEGGSFLASLFLPKALKTLWSGRSALRGATPAWGIEEVGARTTPKEDRWLK